MLPEIGIVHWVTNERPGLDPGEIHVWRIDLKKSTERPVSFFEVLSDSEKKQAERFRFAHLRLRYAIVHASVRLILASYLGQAAGKIELISATRGKPALAPTHSAVQPVLKFNISHSDEMLLVAVAGEYEIGIDLEKIRPEFDQSAVWQHFFGSQEKDWLVSLPPEEQRTAFYRMWTCKEAVLKGDGSGIRRALEQVPVSFGSSGSLAQANLAAGEGEIRDWTIRLFLPGPEYTAALAFPTKASAARRPSLKFYEWSD